MLPSRDDSLSCGPRRKAYARAIVDDCSAICFLSGRQGKQARVQGVAAGPWLPRVAARPRIAFGDGPFVLSVLPGRNSSGFAGKELWAPTPRN